MRGFAIWLQSPYYLRDYWSISTEFESTPAGGFAKDARRRMASWSNSALPLACCCDLSLLQPQMRRIRLTLHRTMLQSHAQQRRNGTSRVIDFSKILRQCQRTSAHDELPCLPIRTKNL